MLFSILAGFLIAMGAAIYLTVGGVVGAVLFSLGLLTILHFQFKLFTGKAGLLAMQAISIRELISIYCGNFIGVGCGASLIMLTQWGYRLAEPASAIVDTRITNMPLENLIYGIFCGLLMYIAVNVFTTMPWVTVMCVSGFILAGFNHCIADMFYFVVGATDEKILPMIAAIMATTIGNIIGCNIIPLSKSYSQ